MKFTIEPDNNNCLALFANGVRLPGAQDIVVRVEHNTLTIHAIFTMSQYTTNKFEWVTNGTST
jgi:hypothetical protein